jgi:predicted negative regulator of RcsB-dependent stress response
MAGSYDFEEQERLAELKAWWEDNRLYVFAAIAGLVLAYAGWQGWRWWSARQAEEAAAMYKPVAEAVKAKDAKKIADAAQPLIAKHPGSF